MKVSMNGLDDSMMLLVENQSPNAPFDQAASMHSFENERRHGTKVLNQTNRNLTHSVI